MTEPATQTSGLAIPVIDTDDDSLTAALAYARAGWYVVPLKRGTKHPGSVLGESWQRQSSRDAQVITSWYAGASYGVALHVGRSGAVVLDVDDPDQLPKYIADELAVAGAPFQSTRTNVDGKGHHVFASPDGRQIGNSLGQLGRGWGEVRGRNGIIVVAPSVHPSEDSGGCYEWLQTGDVPPLPAVLAEKLPDSEESADAATDLELKRFIEEHEESRYPDLLLSVLHRFQQQISEGSSRHDAAVTVTCWAMREARAGAYPAKRALRRIREAFVDAMRTPRNGSDRTENEAFAKAEFGSIASWAVAQAERADVRDIIKRIEQRVPELAVPPPTSPRGEVGEVARSAPEAPGEDQDEDGENGYDLQVRYEANKMRIRAAARELLAAEDAAARLGELPSPVALDVALTRPELEVSWRVDGLLQEGGNALVTALRKHGKSTLIGNLAKALADGEPFLGRFDVSRPAGRTVIINYELTEAQQTKWLADMQLDHPERVALLNLRGHRVPLMTDPGAEWLAEQLKAMDAEVMMVDPAGRAFTASGGAQENDNSEVLRFLGRLDEIKQMAGVSELILPIHGSRSAESGKERARAASAWEDWPDALWRLVRDENGDSYFSAFGRDVELEEVRLFYHEITRLFEINGGSRHEEKLKPVAEAVLEVVEETPGMSKAQIEKALGEEHARNDIRKAIDDLLKRRECRSESGSRGAKLIFIDTLNSSPRRPRRTSPQRAGELTSAPRHPFLKGGEVARSKSAGEGEVADDGELKPGEVAEEASQATGGEVGGEVERACIECGRRSPLNRNSWKCSICESED